MFEFFHDCEELEAWLYERLLKLQTTGLGRDLNHIQVAQQKHKVRHLDLDVAAWSLTKSLYLFKSTAAHYYCLVLFWVLWVFVSLTLQLPFHLVVPLLHVLLHCPHSIFFIYIDMGGRLHYIEILIHKLSCCVCVILAARGRDPGSGVSVPGNSGSRAGSVQTEPTQPDCHPEVDQNFAEAVEPPE